MEEVEQVVVLGWRQAHAAHDAGDPLGLEAQHEGPDDHDEPLKGRATAESATQRREDGLDFAHQTQTQSHTPPPGESSGWR